MPAMMGTNDVAWASPVYWVGEENWLMLATIVVDDGDVGWALLLQWAGEADWLVPVTMGTSLVAE